MSKKTLNNKAGKVYIVGAGPGDHKLITLKGCEKIRHADVVVYDRLINNKILSFCGDKCEKIFVGKKSGHHTIEQDEINNILINKSKAGLNVVRLKGGDPFIFGRGSEEAMALKRAEIEYEIIPGITSGIAAPVYSGIPITQRGEVTQCIFLTAHESAGKPGSQIDFKKLAKLKNCSLIIYMGASNIGSVSEKLIKYGMDPKTPAAVIENGTLPEQRTITATLKKIAAEFVRNKFHSPVITVISPTVLLRDKVSWFEKTKANKKK